MPAHSGDLSDPEEWSHPPVPSEWMKTIYETMPVFDVDMTPTKGMGTIAELFRTLPKTKRSLHPQVSFSALGEQAERITKNHPLTPQLGLESPLGKLYEASSKVLLLGVGYENATCFHLAETMITGMNEKKYGAPMMIEGERKWQWFRDFDYDSDDFNKVGEAFEKTHEVAKGKVGNAVCCLFDLKEGVDFAKKWLEKNR
jgi:aminoglycoside 3-N-acetyltransferase